MIHQTLRLAVAASMCLAPAAFAQINVGSDGSDGAFSPSANIEIDLSLAPTGQWTKPAPVAGRGVYDPDKWAIVFKYSSVNIPANVTVTFKNHPSRAPVIWLVDGSATVAGTINLDGKIGHPAGGSSFSEPGPGGFRGGRAWMNPTSLGAAGLGPGGTPYIVPGCNHPTGASYGALGTRSTQAPGPLPRPTYGSSLLLPILGGSGGAGVELSSCFTSPLNWGGGGSGGGALLLAAGNTISVAGTIRSNGGDGGASYGVAGSGGGIRLIADVVQGAGTLRAMAGTSHGITSASGNGRIRVEANSITLTDVGVPAYSAGLPGNPVNIFPPAAAPEVKVVSIAGQSVDDDPWGRIDFPMQDVSISSGGSSIIVIRGHNVPLDWTMSVRIVPTVGADINLTATAQPGSTQALSTWHAAVTVPSGFSVVQARAFAP